MSLSASAIPASPSDPRSTTRRPAKTGVGAARSLQARITAAILVTVVVALAIGCSLFMLEQHRLAQLGMDRYAESFSQIVGAFEAPALERGEPSAWRADQTAAMRSFTRLQSLRVIDGAGRARLTYVRPDSRPDSATRTYVTPILYAGRRVGQVSAAVARPAPGNSLGEYLAMGGALFFAATGMALFIGRWLAARITTPVARLSSAMDAVGESGELGVRVLPDGRDEIGRLTERFNDLMERLHLKDRALRLTMAELVEARDAAEAANVAKSQFLANMSHEIRTPLNGVLAMAQVLEQGLAQPTQRDQAAVIRQSGETLLGLLNDMLDVSKIEAGRLELEEVEFDFEAMARGAMAGFQAVAARKGLSFDVNVDASALGCRRGDPARVRQVLNNFVSNALKFTEAGGVSVKFAGEGPDGVDGVRFEVADTGIGIPPEKLALVFQRFVQVDASTTRRFGGTGLGLAICEELSAMMGGRVWVESEPGRGSRFCATLPLRRIGEAMVAPAEALSQDEHGTGAGDEPSGQATDPASDPVGGVAPSVRILAAEDNPTNQLVLTTIMQIFGFELTIAADGREAVNLWREGDFDVVLMDIQMPVMDGVAATRAIRSLEAAEGRARTPILALSANALPQQVETYHAAGMDGHVPKPIELARLQSALEAALLGHEGESYGVTATG